MRVRVLTVVLVLVAGLARAITLPCPDQCVAGGTCPEGQFATGLNPDCTLTCAALPTTTTSSTTTSSTSTSTTTTTLAAMSLLWSMADATVNNVTSAAGDFTTGIEFVPETVVTITGCRFFWRGAALGAKTVRCRVWKGGVSQANVDVSAPASD